MSTSEDKFHQPAELEAPQCHGCKHWNAGSTTCAAYPDGIPLGILSNDLDHTEDLDGDHGIQFEPK